MVRIWLENAPSRKKDIRAHGYDVLNNDKVVKELSNMSTITERTDHKDKHVEHHDDQHEPKM
ncbi:hypothetical protein [Legionella tucsonensis]|uniref:Uncharacterized protein n=1 Tax=Legionella tucsonensis TaxID=40335 RepID=A0A0W0ZUM6_9GAMM|nr:hypothetical protein [Legionella tucsonensis]KTD72863.1 hypothetical protein Ltuc_0710 [Legionella tucsonensis]